VHSGSWRDPIFTASSHRMYEPGFFADRIPWLAFLLRRLNAGQLFMTLGMLPLENELGSRALAAFAYSVQRRHGPLPIVDVFEERVASRFPPETKTSDLWRREFFERARTVVKLNTVREPYRREILQETRADVDADLARLEDVVRRGGTFYLTPEGRYTIDGRMLPMRGAVERLAPLATIYLFGVSYDPFVSRRLSMLYRIVPLGDAPMTKKLAAIRPVVASQLLGAWLYQRGEAPFTAQEACDAVRARLAALPPQLFIDPELQAKPDVLVRAALPLMVQWQILEKTDGTYVLAPRRHHPQFPFVRDILEYQDAFLSETIENAQYV
jgi:hypothetical protein